MDSPFTSGQFVQTPFGKGVVLGVRNHGRVLVEVKARALELAASELTALERPRSSSQSRSRTPSRTSAGPAQDWSSPAATLEVDLHGLTVAEALERAEGAIDAALRSDAGALRLVHGRSGGRIKAALQPRLRAISAIRRFRLDPRNAGVTIVEF